MVAAVKPVRHALLAFLAAALVPFVASFAFFLVSARNSVLTTPQEYIDTMKREGSLTYMIALPKWKSHLARGTACRDAEILIIGSSRVREIDQSITGRPTCNLYMDGLEAFGFERLSRALPAVQHRERAAVLLSIDHFWFWAGGVDHFETLEERMLEHSPELWRAYAAVTTLNFFQWRDVVEVTRRYMEPASRRFEDQNSVWYPDGHLFNPRYYAAKRGGRTFTITDQFADDAVFTEFGNGGIREQNLRAFEDGVRRLHDKGYVVRAYWSPVTPQHIAAARRRYPALFEGTITRIDALAKELPFDRYLPAMETLDATRFGCSNDWGDTTHIDLDCLRLVFRTLFPPAGAESTLARLPSSR
jgi:hypothetical protein